MSMRGLSHTLSEEIVIVPELEGLRRNPAYNDNSLRIGRGETEDTHEGDAGLIRRRLLPKRGNDEREASHFDIRGVRSGCIILDLLDRFSNYRCDSIKASGKCASPSRD